ncbi:MAG: lactate utilization protein [Clostridium sp.]|jgi:L-lactate utilization protein LutB|uniref:lactate utilization protein n=1 Tax=Clostridium sp. TaxID=1506 RepID=UPI0025C68A6F|nr:lactate utilization protein [Clostridium sp.]MCH3964127.1 lactate utilization protein [Clostridium sp.]MCI1715308.1 lactate utilization protein [Clostridium sp.]MCI1799901.1 lactate utilization protein [Clostridium sp.]MCI1813491.1 lactate utilization protein [Clostridium sp.]MCI1870719.1 lactate utilization protein [Clostridium sp.]
MDKNEKWVIDQKINRTMENLQKNNMEAYLVKDEKDLMEKLKSLIKEGSAVSVGGSMTLFETGIIDFLRNGKYNFMDRYKDGITPVELKDIYRKTFLCDCYITSSNAVTESGELYNIDGNGNRVAAMIYGPDQVIVIIGANKIVSNLNAAIERVKYNSAPANTKRLNLNTPCTKVGYCVDCKSDGRICNDYVLIKRENVKGRVKVIILNKDLGY